MRTNIIEEIQVTKMETQIIQESRMCNKCGKEFIKDQNDNWNDFYDAEIHGVGFSFGYGSPFDGERWEYDVCEQCMVDYIKTFQYVPEGFKQNEYHLLTPEQHQKVFDNWKETGEWEEFKFATYEDIAKFHGWFGTDYLNILIQKYHPGMPLVSDSEATEK